MKTFITLLTLCFFLTNAEAADWWKSNRRDASGASSGRVSASPAGTIFLTAAPSMIVGDGVALPGVNFQLAGRPVDGVPLNLTLDMGPYFYTSTGFQVAVPILFGLDYEFQLPRNPRIRPVFGVNVGPVVGKRVVFGMLFRPGVNFQIAREVALNFEPRLGVFASSFVFVPQFGVRFTL